MGPSTGPSTGAAMILIAAVRMRKEVVKDTMSSKFDEWLCELFEGRPILRISKQDTVPSDLIYFS